MKILATDLNRPLLPNGSWKADKNAIAMFNELTEQHGVVVVYVTGRNLSLTERAMKEFGAGYPNVLCGDVGTTICRREDGRATCDHGWTEQVKRASPKWDAAVIRESVAKEYGTPSEEVVYCGDCGNDIFPLSPDCLGFSYGMLMTSLYCVSKQQ